MKHNSFYVAIGLLSALAAGPALAQSGTAPRATPPAASTAAMGAGNTGTASTPAASTGTVSTSGWMTQAGNGEWRASRLRGLNAYNGNNEKIGEIEDLLVDASGKVDAAVLSVGGFLGMGEHRVAVPFSQLQFADHRSGPARAGNPGGTGATTGALGNAGNTTALGSTTALANTDKLPDRVVLDMTRDQLKAAPAFRYAR